MVGMFGCEDVQVLLGIYGAVCEGEEWGRVEWSWVDKVRFVNNSEHHGVRSHDDLDIFCLSRYPIDSDGARDVSQACVEVEPRRCIQAPVDWVSVSPSHLYGGLVHVVALSSLCMGCR